MTKYQLIKDRSVDNILEVVKTPGLYLIDYNNNITVKLFVPIKGLIMEMVYGEFKYGEFDIEANEWYQISRERFKSLLKIRKTKLGDLFYG